MKIEIPDEEVKKLKAFLKELNELGSEQRELRDKQDTQQRDFDYVDGRLSGLTCAFDRLYGDRYQLVEAKYDGGLLGRYHILVRVDQLFEDQKERT